MYIYIYVRIQERADGVVEAQLYIRHVTRDNFRKYTLVVENKISIKTTDVELLESTLARLSSHLESTLALLCISESTLARLCSHLESTLALLCSHLEVRLHFCVFRKYACTFV